MSGDLRLWRPGDPVAPLLSLVGRGGILALPTESSYAYGVDPRNPRGVDAVFRLKGRPPSKALGVVIAGIEALECLGVDPRLEAVEKLARVWPAALTAVLPTALDLPAAAGTGSIAVRVPAHEGLRRLLRELGPLTATSANASGEAAVLAASALMPPLAGWDACIVDGPPLPGGPPSTLIRWEGGQWEVLREGAFPLSELWRLN